MVDTRLRDALTAAVFGIGTRAAQHAVQIAEIFENQCREQIATDIPFSGTLDDPEASLWDTLIGIMHNAFVEALPPGFDKDLSASDLIEPDDSRASSERP